MVATLTTALLAGVCPCGATESTPVVEAGSLASSVVETTSITSVTTAAQPVTISVADTVAELIDDSGVSTTTKVAELTAEKSASDSTPDTPVPAGSSADADTDFWHDVEADRGEAVRVKFEGERTFEDLQVRVSAPFQNFHRMIEDDQSIVVFVPDNLNAAAKASPVFTVSAEGKDIDTFSVTVKYPRTKVDPDERSNPLFRLISDLAFRLPQLPFVAQLFEE